MKRIDGFLDITEYDLDEDGVLDLSEDLNGNRRWDTFEDINRNQQLDPGEDLNGNGVLDPSEDQNGNGFLDGFEDENFNGLLDDAPQQLNYLLLSDAQAGVPEKIFGTEPFELCFFDVATDTTGALSLVYADKVNASIMLLELFNGEWSVAEVSETDKDYTHVALAVAPAGRRAVAYLANEGREIGYILETGTEAYSQTLIAENFQPSFYQSVGIAVSNSEIFVSVEARDTPQFVGYSNAAVASDGEEQIVLIALERGLILTWPLSDNSYGYQALEWSPVLGEGAVWTEIERNSSPSEFKQTIIGNDQSSGFFRVREYP